MRECLSWHDAQMGFYTRAELQLPKGNTPWGTHKTVVTYDQFLHAWESLVSTCEPNVALQLERYVDGRDVFVAYVVHVPQRRFRTLNIVPLLDNLGVLYGEGVYRLVFETRQDITQIQPSVSMWSTHARIPTEPSSVCHVGVIERVYGAKPLVECSIADMRAAYPSPNPMQPSGAHIHETRPPLQSTQPASSFRNQRLKEFVEYIHRQKKGGVFKRWQSMVEQHPAEHILLVTTRNRRQEVTIIETGSGNETVAILKSVVGLLGDGTKAIAVLKTLTLQSLVGMYVDPEGYLCLTQRIVVMHRLKPDFCADVIALAQRADELEATLYRDDKA